MASVSCTKCSVTSALLPFASPCAPRRLGDFTPGLKLTENVELNQKLSPDLLHDAHADPPAVAFYSLACESYYYAGFYYIMLQRYPGTIRTFVKILNFIVRMRHCRTRSYQYEIR